MEKGLDSQLWHACAGGMVQMPPVNSKVFYFPQGYAEHAQAAVDLAISFKVPALILCRVAAINFLADSETDEVYAKLNLVPLGNNETDYDEDELTTTNVPEITEKSTSFAKTLTQSDANNGGGFSVPRYCAETIFPKLDYSADPPVQTIIAKDVHGDIWKFRHIYRGTPRRHLLTTGWSTFVNQKKLVAGDSIVFLRTKNGDLCVGIRRAKKRVGGGPESTSGWNASAGNSLTQYGGFSMFLRDGNGNGNLNSSDGFRCVRKVRSDSVIEAAAMAASGQPFEVIYYPRAGTPEFCVKASVVRAAIKVQWTSGMRFKMAFETEDSSRISWFMGTVSSVQVADPIRWPNSPWRLLQVTWDEPDLLQNVKRVSPWLVELVSNMPVIHLSPFSPPRKKLRLPQHPVFPLDAHFPMPSFPGSSFCCLSDNAPAGIQGARHAQFGLSLSDIHFSNKLPPKLLTPSSQLFDQPPKFGNGVTTGQTSNNDGVSCLLTIGNSSQSLEKSDNTKRRPFLLFGQLLVVEEETSQSSSSDGLSQALSGKSSSDLNGVEKPKEFSQGSESSLEQNNGQLEYSSNAGFSWNQGCQTTGLGLDNYHCKVFIMGSEDVVCTLDLSALGSYEELYGRLSNMFGIEREKLLGRVLYRDAAGTLRQTGDEPFSDFMKTAEKLTIHTESGTDKTGRTWLTGLEMKNTEKGLNSSNKTGPLSIFV